MTHRNREPLAFRSTSPTGRELAASERNYQDDPEAPEVAGLVVAGALKELGRGVLQGEAGRLQGCAPRRAEAGEPKVDDFERRVLALVREQHVLRKKAKHNHNGSVYLQLGLRGDGGLITSQKAPTAFRERG